MVLKCVGNLLLCPSLLYFIPTEKHELELNLSIVWYKVQDVNPQWNLTIYYHLDSPWNRNGSFLTLLSRILT